MKTRQQVSQTVIGRIDTCLESHPHDSCRNRTNIDPKFWGPKLWPALHAIAKGYPKYPTRSDMEGLVRLLTGLAYAIPCARCRVNWTIHLHSLRTYDLMSGATLQMWLVAAHAATTVSTSHTGEPRYLSDAEFLDATIQETDRHMQALVTEEDVAHAETLRQAIETSDTRLLDIVYLARFQKRVIDPLVPPIMPTIARDQPFIARSQMRAQDPPTLQPSLAMRVVDACTLPPRSVAATVGVTAAVTAGTCWAWMHWWNRRTRPS